MIKKTMLLGALLSTVIFTLGPTEIFADNTGIVTAYKLNVRSGPSTKYSVVGSLSKNKEVTILSSSQGWHKVRLSNNKEGWTSGKYIKTSQESNLNNNSNTVSNTTNKAGVVTTYKLNVRSGPSTKYSVVGSLSKNKEVTILSISQGWHKVRLSNNKEGWASGKYIKTSQESNSQESNSNNNSNTVSNTTNKSGVVTTYKLNVRSGPSTKYGVVGSLSKNKIVKILSSSQGWHKVRLSNNKEGWASGKYIKTSQDLNSNSNSDNSNNNGINNNSPNQDKKTISVEASAYTGYSTTSTGQKPVWGTIAVDPKVIPYGTKIYIPYFNKVFVANDCGGAIKGNKIDIFMNTRSQCYDWGRRTIEIQILGK